MQNIIKIGLAGLGVVGKSVYQIISGNTELLKLKSKHQLKIVAVSAKTAKDFISSEVKFYENPLDMAHNPEIDVIIELMGGQDIAKQLIISALQNQKKVITANKALLASCGYELAKIASQNNTALLYEAAVAGSVPVIKAYQQSFLASEINKIYGILNGTCNFILSEMTNKKQDFLPSLKQAQELGFAEADPTFDIEGIDTAHKITILATLASGAAPNFSQTYIEGITNIIMKNLNNIETHMRPLHCSDQKREILYVKDNDRWEKETQDKPILTRAIKNIANENIKQIKHWQDKYPDCTSASSRKNDMYLKIVSNSMNGLTEEEGRKNISKIISNVAKETVIQKD